MPDTNSLGNIPLLGHDSCTACGLYRTRTHVVQGYGNLNARLVFVGEAPGKTEDETARPFVGAAGQVLRSILLPMGIDPDLCFFTNVIHCRPPGNKIAEAKGSLCPNIWLSAELARLKQCKVVVALGATACDYFKLGEGRLMRDRVRMDDYRGQHPNGYWVVGAYHPSFIMRLGLEAGRRDANIALVSFVASMQRAMYYLGGLGYFLDDPPDEYATVPDILPAVEATVEGVKEGHDA